MKHALLIVAALFAAPALATDDLSPDGPTTAPFQQNITQRVDVQPAAASPAGPVSNANTNNIDVLLRSLSVGLAASSSPQTCLITIFGGVSGWRDDVCDYVRLAIQLRAMGDTESAIEVLCNADVVRAARKATGKPCASPAGPRGPVFQTGAEGAGGYDRYNAYQN